MFSSGLIHSFWETDFQALCWEEPKQCPGLFLEGKLSEMSGQPQLLQHFRFSSEIHEHAGTLQAQRSTQAHNSAHKWWATELIASIVEHISAQQSASMMSNREHCEHIPENGGRKSSLGRCAFVLIRWPVMTIMVILHCSDYHVGGDESLLMIIANIIVRWFKTSLSTEKYCDRDCNAEEDNGNDDCDICHFSPQRFSPHRFFST